jgi:preprotein translocase subunit SecA
MKLDDQVEQRVELAEMAIEGAELEAEERGEMLHIKTLTQTIEQTAGLRIQIDEKDKDQDYADISQVRKMVPEMIEASLGLRVWSALIQAVERRVGEKLPVETSLPVPIDWEIAERDLLSAFEKVWIDRADRIESDVAAQIGSAKTDGPIDDTLKLRLIVQMAFGQRTFFDRKTHQRKAVTVARFSYAQSAALLIAGMKAEELEEQIIDHLLGAQRTIQSLIGKAELAKGAVKNLDTFDETIRAGIAASLSSAEISQLSTVEDFSLMDDEMREMLAGALGQALFTEAARTLFLSVGDRQWVEYLTQIEALRTSIGLEAYGQRDPLVQYKSKAFDMFQQLLVDVRAGMVSRLFRLQVTTPAASSPSTPRRIEQAPQAEAKPTKKRRRRRRKKKK